MLFRLLSFALSVGFLADIEIEGQEVLSRSYRGRIPALANARVTEMSIRSDGRYLFYATGASFWSVVDLQDMITLGTKTTATDGNVVGLFYRGNNELVTVARESIQLFDVEDVFEPKLERDSYSFPSSSTENTTPIDACMDSENKIFVLESDPDDDHIVRVIGADFVASSTLVRWDQLFSGSDPVDDEVIPVGIRCAESTAVVIGISLSDDQNEPAKLILGRLSLSPPFSVEDRIDLGEIYDEYEWKDLILDARGEQILALFNRIDPEGEVDDSKVVQINPSSFSTSAMNVGSLGQAIASFVSGSNQFYNFFMGRDILGETAEGVPTFQVLELASGSFGNANAILEERGLSSESIGTKDILSSGESALSQWVGVSSDHYAYGLVESAGVSLITDAPYLELVEIENLEVSNSEPAKFSFRSDEDINFEVRLIDDLKPEGESSGIQSARGRKLLDGELDAGEVRDLSITAGKMKINKEGSHRLMVYAERKFAGSSASRARLGLAFVFDEAPPAVENLRTGFGDRSLHIFFDLPRNPGDLKEYLIFLSEDKADLDNLPTNKEELEASWKEKKLRGHGSARISVPVVVPARAWDGSYAVDPLRNNREVFVRVVVVDENNNYSANNPKAVSGMPRLTKSLTTAFGSGSCVLGSSSPSEAWKLALQAFMAFALIWFYRRRLKKT